jgi:hypothetical protein
MPRSKKGGAAKPRLTDTPSGSGLEGLQGWNPYKLTDQWFEAQPAEGTMGTADATRFEDLLISDLKPNLQKEQWAPQMPSIWGLTNQRLEAQFNRSTTSTTD